MNRRRGFTLIELLVVLAVGAVLVGVAVTLLYALMRTEGSGRDHLRHSNVLGRLADQFRRDVHAAKNVGALADGKGWQFELGPDRTVTYRLGSGRLTRSEQVDGAVERRESFVLPADTTASIQIEADNQPKLVSLAITPAAEPPGQTGRRAIYIDAVLARDHRFTGSEEPEGDERE